MTLVARQRVPTGGQFDFNLSPGRYDIELPYYGDGNSLAPWVPGPPGVYGVVPGGGVSIRMGSWVSVVVRGGVSVRADLPNACMQRRKNPPCTCSASQYRHGSARPARSFPGGHSQIWRRSQEGTGTRFWWNTEAERPSLDALMSAECPRDCETGGAELILTVTYGRSSEVSRHRTRGHENPTKSPTSTTRSFGSLSTRHVGNSQSPRYRLIASGKQTYLCPCRPGG